MSPVGRFLTGEAGALAVVGWSPDRHRPRFGVLHVPAFADEMNKSRRVVAAQARALASIGGATFTLDPRGTGDSGGDFGDATWIGWRADVIAAWEVLRGELSPDTPWLLWGSRFGALLATDLVCSGSLRAQALLLWQPVVAGKTFFNQFFRLAAAQDWVGRADEGGKSDVRAALAEGRRFEIGGYEIDPRLVSEAEAIDLSALAPPECPVVVRETSAVSARQLTAASAKFAAAWRDKSAIVDADVVAGPSFWAAQELESAPALIDSTTSAVEALLATWAGASS